MGADREGREPAGAVPMRGLVAVVLGNWLEFYDFLVFTFFAVMIGDAFFPGGSEIVRLLGALATFGAGFVTRPIGAAVIGAYADRVGRSAALSLTLILMAVSSAMVALTPSYSSIGLAAPALLVLARLLQGFSCGGEVGPATTYLLENAPPGKRAALTAWQAYSQQLAIILGSLIGVVLAVALTKEQLYAWGWRVPFAIGVLIAPVGLYIRRRLPDTHVGGAIKHTSTFGVLGDLFRHHAANVIIGVFIISGGTISTYCFNYMNTYAITTLHLSAAIGTTITLTGAVAAIVGLWTGVWVDRFGRRRSLIVARVVFVLSIYPAYALMTSSGATPIGIITINVFENYLFCICLGSSYAFLAEAFPPHVRSTGLSVLYALGVAIFGGTTQFVIAYLIDRLHDPLVPAYYQIAANLLTITGIALLRPHVDSPPDR